MNAETAAITVKIIPFIKPAIGPKSDSETYPPSISTPAITNVIYAKNPAPITVRIIGKGYKLVLILKVGKKFGIKSFSTDSFQESLSLHNLKSHSLSD